MRYAWKIVPIYLNYIYFAGVYLALRNQFIANNTQINIRSIGQYSDNPNSAPQCITDRKPCCFGQNSQHGEWYLPDGRLVQGSSSHSTFYRGRGNYGEVYLNRPPDVGSPTGQYCCEVPDATGTNQMLCMTIGNQIIY